MRGWLTSAFRVGSIMLGFLSLASALDKHVAWVGWARSSVDSYRAVFREPIALIIAPLFAGAGPELPRLATDLFTTWSCIILGVNMFYYHAYGTSMMSESIAHVVELRPYPPALRRVYWVAQLYAYPYRVAKHLWLGGSEKKFVARELKFIAIVIAIMACAVVVNAFARSQT